MKYPLVSIIIPVYNGSDYLKQAIDSALAQTYHNIEVIVVNDGSNDNGATESIVLSYGDKLRYIKKENGGVSSALNVGINAMRGEYFSWLSHDDVYMPAKVEEQIKMLCKLGQENSIAMCANKQIDKESNDMGKPRMSKLPVSSVIDWKTALNYVFEHNCNGCTLLIPKSVFKKCGVFNEELRYSQDFLMWATIFLNGYSLVYSDNVGVGSRVHNKQVTQTRRDLFVHDSGIIADILCPKLAEISNKKDDFLYEYAKTNAIHNNDFVVKNCIVRSRISCALSLLQIVKLKLFCVYGTIRPTIRRLYYQYVKKVSTQ